MKQLKRKDLILEHYMLAKEATVFDKVTNGNIVVRVWKPKTMGELPDMKSFMETTANNLQAYWNPEECNCPKENGACWITDNPDYGAWDAQIVKRMDYRQRKVDIYVCALLVRPFSSEAQQHYGQRMGLQPWERLLLMWDSRRFDNERGISQPLNS